MSTTQDSQRQTASESTDEQTRRGHDLPSVPVGTTSQTFDTIIIHSDGSYCQDGDLSGTGFTLETNGGEVITEQWDTAPNAETSMETEAAAALAAVRTAKQFDPSYIILYSDCKPLVDRLDQDHSPAAEGSFHHNAYMELQDIEFTSVAHIPRERNMRADDLAHRGLRELRGNYPNTKV